MRFATRPRLAIALLVLAVPGVPAADQASPEVGAVAGFYEGVLPCADCGGIRYRLQLRADKVFVQGQDYLGRPAGEAIPRNVLGVWSESADGRIVVLRDAVEAPVLFSLKAPGLLRKLDDRGRPIESKFNFDLVRREPPAPFEPLLRLQGMYSEAAGAGAFRECLSRERFRVADTGDHAALQSAYGADGGGTGRQLLVTIEGHLTQSDGLVVEHFVGMWPGESCGDPLATAKLVNTYWKLTRLGDRPVPTAAAAREPHLVLKEAGEEITGFSGCNNFMGRYRREAQNLDLGRIAATMMACANGMDQEQDFLHALQATVRWNILGEHLELYDKQGKMLARFEARYVN